MELNGAGRLRRNGALAAPARQSARAGGPAGIRSAAAQAKADRLSLSRQALAFLEEENRKAEEQAREGQSGSGESSMLDAMKKALKEMKLCETIAARVMAGDKVPPEDLRYLMQHDMNTYRLALAMRKPKKDPKEWESALEEEDREERAGRTAEASGDAGAGAVSASGGATGGSPL